MNFQELYYDLEDFEDKVISLHDTTDSLLSNSDDSENAKERLHVVASQLKSLLKICKTYMTRIESVLNLDKELLHSSVGDRKSVNVKKMRMVFRYFVLVILYLQGDRLNN
jgi:DNA repair ATPase RecN